MTTTKTRKKKATATARKIAALMKKSQAAAAQAEQLAMWAKNNAGLVPAIEIDGLERPDLWIGQVRTRAAQATMYLMACHKAAEAALELSRSR